MPERKPYPQTGSQRVLGYPAIDSSTVNGKTADGSPARRSAKPLVLRLAPDVWAILHPVGLCLWAGDSHGAAWEHINSKTRDIKLHTQDARN